MTLRARLVGRASLAGLAPLLLALLGACSSDSAASNPNGPTAMEVLGLDPAGARVCLGDGRPPAELRVKNTGRRTFGYTVEAPMPLDPIALATVATGIALPWAALPPGNDAVCAWR
mgnify:CR=1 FL=1